MRRRASTYARKSTRIPRLERCPVVLLRDFWDPMAAQCANSSCVHTSLYFRCNQAHVKLWMRLPDCGQGRDSVLRSLMNHGRTHSFQTPLIKSRALVRVTPLELSSPSAGLWMLQALVCLAKVLLVALLP